MSRFKCAHFGSDRDFALDLTQGPRGWDASDVVAGLVSPVFIGRRDELAAIGEAQCDALAGSSVAVVVAGEAGVGKTRFLAESQQLAVAGGMAVASGRCVELSQEGVSYAPLVGVLRSLSRALDAEALDGVLGHARRELAGLLPELDPSASADPAAPGQAARLFELALGVLERAAAHQPLMVIIEDLHWADRATLDLVCFLVAELRDAPVLLVLTYRSDEMHRSHPLRAVLSGWSRARQVRHIELAPLTRAEVASLLTAIMGEEPGAELVDRVLRRSEGNPFLAEEFIGVMRDGADPDRLPDSIRELLLARLTATTQEIQALLRAVAAAAGRPIGDELLAMVTGQDPRTRQESLRAAVEHQLLAVDDSGGFVFRHALTREAVYDDMLPGERAQLHAAFGDALESDDRLAGDGAPVDALLAYHWDAARDLPRAFMASVRAAGSSSMSFAPDQALAHLERAVGLWPRVPDAADLSDTALIDLLVRASDLAIVVGAPAKALTLADQALEALPLDQPARRAMMLEQKAVALRDLSRVEERMSVLAQALEAVPADCHRERGVVLHAIGGAILLSDSAAALPLLEEAVQELGQGPSDQHLADACSALGTVKIRLGDLEEGLASLAIAIRIANETGSVDTLVMAQLASSDVFGMLGRHDESVAGAREALEAARRGGVLHSATAALTVCNLVEALIRLGRWPEADALLAEHGGRESAPYAAAALRVLAGQLAVARGDRTAAAEQAQRARDLDAGIYDIGLDAAFVDSEVARLASEIEHAQQIATDALEGIQPEWEERYVWPLVWQGLRTTADLASSRNSQQGEKLEMLATITTSLPGRGPRAHAYRALADAERARASRDADEQLWQEVLVAWRELAEPLMTGYCLLRVAEARRAAGRRDRAADALREGLDIATRLGAQPLIEDLTGLARRARITVDNEAASSIASDADASADAFGLTERERQVLSLIAEGQTNKDIAATLYISPKTAGIHVSHILDKLGVRGRVEAATLAVQHGLVSR
jgi:DNA-binding CsgD family transcriptional regulator/tetratricopeptide (TPR) repeat protein